MQSLVALTSYYNGYFQQCSRAFTKLETMESDAISTEKREQFAELAMDIFTANKPADPLIVSGHDALAPPCHTRRHHHHHRHRHIVDWRTSVELTVCRVMPQVEELGVKHWCVASGKSISPDSRMFTCKTCKRKCLERAIRNLRTCPLCHTPIGGMLD